MPSQLSRKRFYLKGRVQGVGCRAQIRNVAQELGGLRGYVKNLADGRVEVVAEASPEEMQEFESILRENLASPVRVDEIEVESLSEESAIDDSFQAGEFELRT